MLYVFRVDTGIMLTFDMNLAMDSVSRLQEVISQTCQIAEDKQVLLISGGQSLSPSQRVCSYSAGTDTNPIFLFSKNTIESASPPGASVSYDSSEHAEADLKERVEGSMNMPPSYETIVTRSQLALKFHDVAQEQLTVCQKLVHNQHLQHQGWAAVIANLEDITSAFRKKWLGVSEKVEQHLNDREHRIKVLGRFPETVQLLSKIPLLQCLVPSFALSMSATMAASTPSPTTPAQSVVSDTSVTTPAAWGPTTLLEWIMAQESRKTVDQMAKQCLDGLNQFDETVRDGLREEVEGLLVKVNNPYMKEIRGVEDRLSALEQLMYGAHKVLQEQADMAQGFLANQTRARNLQDPSVLPDLCTSHKRQLVVMLKNHQNLLDIRSRCMRAKDELSKNLHTRLRWLMYMEESIHDMHGKLVIYHQHLLKLQHCLRLILQMHNAPEVYCSAVLEVIRRKQFASNFLEWSCSLCAESNTLHEKELEKRYNFSSFFRNHFLEPLFPGFGDKPPGFATKLPKKFDENLPPIDKGDLQFLKQSVPELAEKLNIPDDINLSLVFPQLSVCDTFGRSSKDSFSQTTHSLESLGDQPSSIAEVSESLDAFAEVPPSDGREQLEESHTEDACTAVESEQTLEIRLLDQPGITVSQSVEVVQETDMASMDEEDESLGAIKVGPHVGLSPTAEVPQGPKAAHKERGSSDGLLVSKVEKRDVRGTPTNSPDSDEGASEGFTTADFYFDESMPSSLTESAGRKLAELQQVIQEKALQIEHRDRELEDHKQSLEQTKLCLTKAQENFQLLHDMIQKGTLQFRCDVLSVEKQVTKEKEEFASFMDSLTRKLIDMIGSFEESQTSRRDLEIERVKDECAGREVGLEEKLEVEHGKLVDARSKLEIYDRKLKEKTDECDTLKQTHTKSVSEMKDQHQEEVTAVMNQMILEQEVELEKVKNDLDLALQATKIELQELSDALDLKTKQLASQQADMEKQEEILSEKFQKEKEEIRRIIVAEFEEKEIDTRVTIKEEIKRNFEKKKQQIVSDSEDKLQSLEETLQEQHKADKETALSVMKEDLDNTHEAALETVRTDLAQQRQADLNKLRESCEAEQQEKIDNLTSHFETERQRLQDEVSQLRSDHEQEIKRLKRESLVVTDACETSPMLNLSVEDYVTISSHKEELQKVVDEQQQQKEQEISELVTKFEKEKHDSLQDMKTSTTADKQVIFNEALSKVVADHQQEMEEMKRTELDLRQQLDQARRGLRQASRDDKAAQYPSLGSLEARPVPIPSELDHELDQAKLRIVQLEAQLSTLCQQTPVGLPALGPLGLVGPPAPQPGLAPFPGGAMGVSVMGQSIVPVTDPAADPRIQTLEATIRSKTEEVNKLSHKIMELSMSTSFRGLLQDKVSITSCNPGDLVLLCLDDQRANYVVFTVTNLLHFLHSEYLDILGLKTGAGETKKSWVLAEVTDKEYCQAKKPQNRYNVPVGTKFYRIKTKPWSREQALQQQQQLRQQHLMPGIQGLVPSTNPQPSQPQPQPLQPSTQPQPLQPQPVRL